MLSDQQRKRAFNAIILTQCLGMLAAFLNVNGFYVSYFSSLGISSSQVALLLSIPSLLSMVLLIPFAYSSDRQGKMKIAMLGQLMMVLGLAALLLAGVGRRTPQAAMGWAVCGMLIMGVGGSLQGSNWFALLNPIIPKEIRGRFFGRLRVTFQLVSVVFALVITRVLAKSQAPVVYQGIMGVVLLAMVLRTWSYRQIPELEDVGGEAGPRKSFGAAFRGLMAHADYRSFNCYIFLLLLFTMAAGTIFVLLGKDTLGFEPAQLTQLGTLLVAGGIAGCWMGGKLVDRFGTRVVFVGGHVLYAVVLLAVLTRGWMPWPALWHMSGLSFALSLVAGAVGIAVTSEMLGLIPAESKSLSTAFTMALMSAADGLSKMAVSNILKWQVLAPEWAIGPQRFSAYDTLLLGSAVMILLLLVTLSLVPSVIKHAQLWPQTGEAPRV